MWKNKLYLIYCAFWFVFIFLLNYPLFLFCTLSERFHRFSRIPYKIWSYTFFPLAFLPVEKIFHYKRKPGDTVVYCANHTSYLDIPILTYVLPGYFIYIGKSSLTKIPLFGYTFKKLHITVDRKSGEDRKKAVLKGSLAVADRKSLVVFPEGGINPNPQPHLREFKDGAFRIAIERQVPIVPVTVLNTWKVFPDLSKPSMHRHKIKVILHPAIPTVGMTEEDLPFLKEKTKQAIATSLFEGQEIITPK